MDKNEIIYYLGLVFVVSLLIYVVMKSLTLQMNIIEGATGGRRTTSDNDVNSDDNATTNVVDDDSSKQKASGWGSYFASRAPSSIVQQESSTDKDKIADAVKSNTHTIEDKLLISKYRSSYEQTIIELEDNVSYALLSAVINNAEMISNNPTSSNSQTMINSINNLKTFRQTLNDAMKILDSK